MDILAFPLGPLETNCYLAMAGKAALAVDPGGNPGVVLNEIEKPEDEGEAKAPATLASRIVRKLFKKA